MKLHNSTLTRNENFVFRHIVEEMVLVPIRQNVAELDSIYTLNELGAFIWEHLDSPRSHTELEEADWFTRAEVAAAMAGDEDGRFIAPPPQAIAHHLLKWWLNQ